MFRHPLVTRHPPHLDAVVPCGSPKFHIAVAHSLYFGGNLQLRLEIQTQSQTPYSPLRPLRLRHCAAHLHFNGRDQVFFPHEAREGCLGRSSPSGPRPAKWPSGAGPPAADRSRQARHARTRARHPTFRRASRRHRPLRRGRGPSSLCALFSLDSSLECDGV